MKYASVVVVGQVLYLVVLKLLLKLFSIEVNMTYGVYTRSVLDILRMIPSRIKYTYSCFVGYFFSNGLLRNCYFRPQMFTALFAIIAWIKTNRVYKKKFQCVCIIVLIALAPLAAGITATISPDNPIGIRNSEPIIFCIPCMLMFTSNKNKLMVILQRCTYFVLIGICGTFFFPNNVQYEFERQMYNQEHTFASQIVYELEKIMEYERGMPVCII